MRNEAGWRGEPCHVNNSLPVALNRWMQLQTGREAVIAAPKGEDGAVANTLLKALQAADQIGGHK